MRTEIVCVLPVNILLFGGFLVDCELLICALNEYMSTDSIPPAGNGGLTCIRV